MSKFNNLKDAEIKKGSHQNPGDGAFAGEISWAKAQVNCFDELPAERCRPSKEKHQKSEKSRRVSYEQEIESRRDQVNHDLETIRESM